MTDKTGGPAFPTENETQTGQNTWRYEGMTLRDYFAAMAMQSLLSGPESQLLEMKSIAAGNDGDVEGVISHFAYKQADAMLKAREALT